MLVRAEAVEAFDWEGLRIADYGPTARLSAARIDVPPGARHARAHSRRSDKLYYVLWGRVRFGDDELGPGDIYVVPQGERFAYANLCSEPAALLLVHTPPFELTDDVFDV